MDDLNKILDYLKQFDKRLSQLENNKIKRNPNEITYFNNLNSDQALSNKMQSRIDLMQTLRDMYPGYFITIAKRIDGGGLLITSKTTGDNFRLKFYKSKNWSSQRLFGWFTIRAVDIFENNFDLYALSVDYENQTHNFIFSKQQLLQLVEKKKLISYEKNGELIQEDILHFYIEQQGNHFFETREVNQSLDKDRGEIKGGIDVSNAYNHLSQIGEIIGESTQTKQEKAYVFTDDEKVIKNLVYEILEHTFLIPIRRSDFVFSGGLLGYLEYQGIHTNYEISENILKNLKRVVLHIDIDADKSLSDIETIKASLIEKIGSEVPLIIGVSLNTSKFIKSSIVFIGEYLLD